ncbi:MAG: GGDEF domain-containing protein [Armatimonadetes bacterium]|nr:GGDEF domain-containing protein [Armatimonadota bacterium]
MAAITAGLGLTAEGDFTTGLLVTLIGSLYVLFTALSAVLEEQERTPCQTAIVIADLFLISGMVWITGGVQSEYYVLYYLPLMVAGTRRDMMLGILATVLAVALYALTSFVAPQAPPVMAYRPFHVLTVAVTGVVLVLLFALLGREARISDDLRETLHHSLRRVAAVYDVAHAANTGADLAGVLSIILDHAARATGAANGSMFLFEEEELIPMASLSTPQGDGKSPTSILIEPARRSLAARTPLTVVANRDESDSEKQTSEIVYVPLITPAGSVGVLSLVSRGGREFGRRHLDFLTSLCSEAALAIENAQLRTELRKLAVTDPLTGILNRREVERRLSQELERAARYDRSLAFLMVDVDDLKTVNDEFGHAAGDEVLCAFAEAAKTVVRTSDLVGRMGGDEFALVLPESDAKQAEALAERLIEAFSMRLRSRRNLPEPELIAEIVGVSVGITTNADTPISSKELAAAADSALYEAKRRGKNRAVVLSTKLPVKA